MDVRFRPLGDWPQPETKGRKNPQFRSTWSQTLTLLDAELRHLGAKNVVVEVAMTARDIRLDGWPRADARASFPGVIVSFDSRFGPLRYLTDTFENGGYWVPGGLGRPGRMEYVPGWQNNLRAIALSMEALRAVDRYGVSKRGEQYVGWGQLPPGRPMHAAMTVEEAFRHLGLPRLDEAGGPNEGPDQRGLEGPGEAPPSRPRWGP